MAATYVESICARHPFLDGNKRTGAACALAFLYINGFDLEENYCEEFADKVIALVKHEIDKASMAQYFRENSRQIE